MAGLASGFVPAANKIQASVESNPCADSRELASAMLRCAETADWKESIPEEPGCGSDGVLQNQTVVLEPAQVVASATTAAVTAAPGLDICKCFCLL